MVDTVVSDGLVFPRDEGVGSVPDDTETWHSAGYEMLLSQMVDSDSYVRSDSELEFTNHDGTNDTVDITPGVAYLSLAGVTVDVQSDTGGSEAPAYDTALPTLPAICAVIPNTIAGVDATSGTTTDVYLAFATDGAVDGVDAGDVWIRAAGGASEPAHPSVLLGSVDSGDSSADTLGERYSSPTHEDVTVTGEADIGTASVGEINTVTRLRPGDDLSNKTESGDQHMVLPIGTCTVSSALGSADTLVVSGQGMAETTLQLDSADVLWWAFDDAPESDIVFRNLTIDMDSYDFARGIYLGGTRREVRLENVRLENFNLGSVERDGFISTGGGIDPVIDNLHIEGCVWDFSNVTNRSQYHAVSTSEISPVTTASIVGNRHKGSLSPDHSNPIRGYMIRVNESGIIRDNHYKEIDQYGTFLEGVADGASVKVVNNTSVDSGYGDFFRAGASTSSGVSVEISGNSWRGRDPSVEPADRAFIVDGQQAPELVKVTNNDASDSRVPIEVSAGTNVVVEGNTIREFGSDDDTDTRPGIQIRDTDGIIEDVSVQYNVLVNDSSTSDRYAVGIELDEINGNWGGSVLSANNIINGPSTAVVNNVSSVTPTIRDNET